MSKGRQWNRDKERNGKEVYVSIEVPGVHASGQPFGYLFPLPSVPLPVR